MPPRLGRSSRSGWSRSPNTGTRSPQTQGKIERFHKTLKRWLRKRDRATSIAELQAQVDTFIRYYNEERPHSARGMVPPRQAYEALVKAAPGPE